MLNQLEESIGTYYDIIMFYASLHNTIKSSMLLEGNKVFFSDD